VSGITDMFDDAPTPSLASPARDGVGGLDADRPTIVSLPDIHGYVQPARSALQTLADHPDFDPVVTADPAEGLQWAGGEDFVLVFNGDLIDRGPDTEAVVGMVTRLAEQAPDGHVRVTLGNHEMGVLAPDRFGWTGWFSAACTDDQRRAFADRIDEGFVVAAYEGHTVTYAHAGRPEPYETTALNDNLVAAAERLRNAVGTGQYPATQLAAIDAYPEVLGLGGATGRGPGAGVAWLDLTHMPEDAPPQVLGHTRHERPRRKGNVLCANTIRNTKNREGGEAVVVETPDRLLALARESSGGVRTYQFTLPA
jgi:hypothetical protein